MNTLLLLSIAGACGVGLALGLVHFHLLQRNVDAYLAGGALGRALLLHTARLCLTGLGFLLLAWVDAEVLLGGFGGFLVAKTLQARSREDGR